MAPSPPIVTLKGWHRGTAAHLRVWVMAARGRLGGHSISADFPLGRPEETMQLDALILTSNLIDYRGTGSD